MRIFFVVGIISSLLFSFGCSQNIVNPPSTILESANTKLPIPTDGPVIISVKSDFINYWSLAKDKNKETKISLFRELIINKHRQVYEGLVSSDDADLDRRVERFLDKIIDSESVNRIIKSFEKIESVTPDMLNKYKVSFPDAYTHAKCG